MLVILLYFSCFIFSCTAGLSACMYPFGQNCFPKIYFYLNLSSNCYLRTVFNMQMYYCTVYCNRWCTTTQSYQHFCWVCVCNYKTI